MRWEQEEINVQPVIKSLANNINVNNMKSNNQFEYPMGKCKGIRFSAPCQKEETKLIGYSFFNVQMIEDRGIYPTGEKEVMPTCLECYLHERPFMEERMKREKEKDLSIIPYKWFWFYNDEDEKEIENEMKKWAEHAQFHWNRFIESIPNKEAKLTEYYEKEAGINLKTKIKQQYYEVIQTKDGENINLKWKELPDQIKDVEKNRLYWQDHHGKGYYCEKEIG